MRQLILDWLLDPMGLVLLWTAALALVAAVTHGRRSLPRSLAIGLVWYAGIAFVSAPAVVNPLVGALERKVAPGECAAGTPLIVLGGGVSGRQPDVSRFEAMSPATLTRLSAAARLALRDDAVLIVSGGAIGLVSEADFMADFLVRLGLAPERIVREARALSTAENAERIAALLAGADASAGSSIPRLVTSALHMPRAVASFQAVGMSVCPVPVDRQAIDDVPRWALWPQTTALVKFDRWWHEQLASLAYRLRRQQ